MQLASCVKTRAKGHAASELILNRMVRPPEADSTKRHDESSAKSDGVVHKLIGIPLPAVVPRFNP